MHACRSTLEDPTDLVGKGEVDAVLNLAAGLDTRPYRLKLPGHVRWIEVDLPSLVAHKERELAGEKPVCQVERLSVDLSVPKARLEALARIASSARKVLVLSEGLLIYLEPEEVRTLSKELASFPSFSHWAVDLTSPEALRYLQNKWGKALEKASAPMKFGPEESAGFFAPSGWRSIGNWSFMTEARRLNRYMPNAKLWKIVQLLMPRKVMNRAKEMNGVFLLKRAG